MVEKRHAGAVPDFSVSMPGVRLTHPLVTYIVKENGVTLPPIEINYKKTLGWDIGDPRIAALNLIAKLTNTPELIQRATHVAATTVDKEEAQRFSIDNLFQRVLIEDSYTALRDVLEVKFLTATFFDHLGLPRNFLSAFSMIAGIGEDALSSDRVAALQAVNNLIRLRGSILKVGVDAFMEDNPYVPTNLETIAQQQEFSDHLRAELVALCGQSFLRFQSAEEILRRLGITYRYGMDDKTIIYYVLQEINSGNMNLFDHERQPYATHWERSNDFEYVREGGESVLTTPDRKRTGHFNGWKSENIIFSDASIVKTRNRAVKCPFPQFARK